MTLALDQSSQAPVGWQDNPVDALLRVEQLSIDLLDRDRRVPIVEGLSLEIGKAEFFALVGESGSGKSITCFALMNLLAPNLEVRGRAHIEGRSLLSREPAVAASQHNIAMIFQNPSQCLNPVRSIGFQLVEVLRHSQGLTRSQARGSAREHLQEVGLSEPERIMRSYPHQLSGGMNQRVMIALALASQPALLIADEPTSSLDVTTQSQILDLVDRLRLERGMSILFVTHDLATAAERADRAGVLYAGRLVEYGSASSVFGEPRHRYTDGLLSSVPRFGGTPERLEAMEGYVPSPGARPKGCRFAPRCSSASGRCDSETPDLSGSFTHSAACFHPIGTLR